MRVDIVEVGARDGLQAEERVLPVPVRLELIERCVTAGVRRIEVCSFAHPRHVPQMAGAEEIVAALPADRSWSAIGLVLNDRGLDRALATTLDEINMVAYASDGYAGKNTGAGADDRNREAAELVERAAVEGRRVSVTISVAFGDPVDGPVDPARVGAIAATMAEAGAHEIALGDTTGIATPPDVERVLAEVRRTAPGSTTRAHFHNTHNTGYANVVAALGSGVDALDASVGGFGGSPFAPAAGGNVATEDVVWMLERMGVATGLDAMDLAGTGTWLADALGHPEPPAMLARAGGWPA